MGMMAARNQEAGVYFRPSDTFVPMAEGLAPEELNSVPGADQIEVDFKSDWSHTYKDRSTRVRSQIQEQSFS